ncbi:hypothetical protein MOBT1_001225 [Malassezia obtusa]|uniref:NEDD8-activating enzyme E1 regulatory subunit n=1 Tax=Malassezia obtusa TaxID=76774 RepID=A0AAF0IVZ4_9BASI|nr:hypothetical protein MOBT1_001225 [Malassezia obtusa]
MATARPDRHAQRYDRQLRLWNTSGQAALEHARVLVVGASALAGQILKNLVLPGLGAFTVLDDARVAERDIGTNFFLDAAASVGRPYAEELARLVAELNPDVAHAAHVEVRAPRRAPLTQAPAALLARDPAFFTQFSLIVCVRQPRAVQERIAELAWAHTPAIPVLCAHSSGFQGLLQVCVRELGRTCGTDPVIETHPDSLVDLRLTRPFAELSAFAASFDLAAHDSLQRSHIPYVVLLVRALDDWRAAHGALPSSASRAEFLAFLRARRPEGDSENYDEALAALAQHVWRPLQSPAVPPNVAGVLDDVQAREVSSKVRRRALTQTPPFWLLVAALRAFVAEEHVLPLSGALPDMKATSETYVALQRVYVDKARRDLATFEACLDAVLARAGVARPDAGLDEAQVRTFVKHAAHLRLVRGRRLVHQRTDPDVGAMALAFADPVNPVTVQYLVAFLAADAFFAEHARYPTQPADERALVALADAYARDVHLALGDAERGKLHAACAELIRGAQLDLASTAAFLGGIVAQEAIKILTVQYLPLDNTCVYDGVAQAIGSIRL